MELERFLRLGCDVVIDSCATTSFIKQGLAPYWYSSGRCCCKKDHKSVYRVSDMPWYRPDVPESERFFGFMVSSMTSVVPIDSALQGMYAGPINTSRRLITINMSSVTSSAAATNYGRQWLSNIVRRTNQVATSLHVCGQKNCDHSSGLIRVACTENGDRMLRDVRLKSFEVVSDATDTACSGESYQLIFSAAVETANSSEHLCGPLFFDFTEGSARSRPFITLAQRECIGEIAPVCAVDNCNACDFCGSITECDCSTCFTNDVIPCYCEPLYTTYRSCLLRSKTGFGAAAQIRVEAGSYELRNLKVQLFHTNAADPTIPSDINNDCDDPWVTLEPCAEIIVPFVCNNTALVIDGFNKTVTFEEVDTSLCNCVSIDGQVMQHTCNPKPLRSSSAIDAVWSRTGAGIDWPRIASGQAWLLVSADWYNTSEDANVTFRTYELEMA